MFKTYGGFLYHNFRLSIKTTYSSTLTLTRQSKNIYKTSATMYHDKRHFDNPFPDYSVQIESDLIDNNTKEV